MRDPLFALDLDLAIATRARAVEQEHLADVIQGSEDGAFFNAVIALLDR